MAVRELKIFKLKMILYQALRVEIANPLYFSAYIIRLIYKIADFDTEY